MLRTSCHRSFLAAISLLLVGLPVSLGLAQSTDTGDGVRLKWKLDPGTKLDVEMVQEMTMDMTIGTQEMTTTSSTTTWMGWEVTGRDANGLAEVTTKVTRVKLDMDAPMMGKINYDSDSGEEPTGMAANLATTFKPMIGVPMKQTINQRGEIVNVEIPEEALKGMQSGPMGGDSKQMFQQMTKNASLAFPDKPLKKGTSWTSESEMKTPVGLLAVTNEHTYAGVKEVDGKTLHQIDANMTMEFKKGEANPMLGEVEVKDQDTKGSLYFNAETGLLDHSDVNQNMTMLIKVQGQEITQKMNQNVKVNFNVIK